MASPKVTISGMAVSWFLSFFHQVDILPGQFADAIEVSGGDCLGSTSLSADTETAGACLQEIGSRAQIDPAGGMTRTCGNGPRIALKNAGPTTSAGNTLTMSAPASHADNISVE